MRKGPLSPPEVWRNSISTPKGKKLLTEVRGQHFPPGMRKDHLKRGGSSCNLVINLLKNNESENPENKKFRQENIHTYHTKNPRI